jgi:hypothetical protein
LHASGFIIPCIQSTYARVGLSINKPIKDSKGYIVNAFPFLYTNEDIGNVAHSDLLQILHCKILIAIKRQDEVYVKKGQLKFAKIYAKFSPLDDLTPLNKNGTPSFPIPDELVTDNGLLTLARSAFGSPVKHDAENLSLYEDQPFVQQLFTYQECGYPNVAIIELGYPFNDKTREEVINSRLTMVLSAVVVAPQHHAERLLANTLRSLQKLKELSARSTWKVRELVDFIAQRPVFKELYFELFQKQLKLFENRKFSDDPDSTPSKRRLTTPETP